VSFLNVLQNAMSAVARQMAEGKVQQYRDADTGRFISAKAEAIAHCRDGGTGRFESCEPPKKVD